MNVLIVLGLIALGAVIVIAFLGICLYINERDVRHQEEVRRSVERNFMKYVLLIMKGPSEQIRIMEQVNKRRQIEGDNYV